MKTQTQLYPLFRVIERTEDGDELEHFSSYNLTLGEEKLIQLRKSFPMREYYICSDRK